MLDLGSVVVIGLFGAEYGGGERLCLGQTLWQTFEGRGTQSSIKPMDSGRILDIQCTLNVMLQAEISL